MVEKRKVTMKGCMFGDTELLVLLGRVDTSRELSGSCSPPIEYKGTKADPNYLIYAWRFPPLLICRSTSPSVATVRFTLMFPPLKPRGTTPIRRSA